MILIICRLAAVRDLLNNSIRDRFGGSFVAIGDNTAELICNNGWRIQVLYLEEVVPSQCRGNIIYGDISPECAGEASEWWALNTDGTVKPYVVFPMDQHHGPSKAHLIEYLQQN